MQITAALKQTNIGVVWSDRRIPCRESQRRRSARSLTLVSVSFIAANSLCMSSIGGQELLFGAVSTVVPPCSACALRFVSRLCESFLQLLTRLVKVSDLVYGGVKPLVKRFEYRIDFFQEKFF